MKIGKRSLTVGVVGASLLCVAFAAHAQEAAPAETVIGPPQLKDFSLQPTETIVAQPPPVARQPATNSAASPASPPPPAASAASSPPGGSARAQPPADTAASPTPRPAPVLAPAASGPGPAATDPDPSPFAEPAAPDLFETPAPVEAAPATDAAVPTPAPGTPWWLYALGLALVGLGAFHFHRRRLREALPAAAPAVPAAPVAPETPRAEPVPRPWLELSIKAERATFTDTEAQVWFELEIANSGGSAARDLRIDVKMFNAGAEQDKEIGAFFRTAGRESTKLALPGVDAGVTGVLQGSVRLPLEEMRAIRMDERLLFIPVVAVNALYDWGNGRTGQTSRSYVIGRELDQPSEKMGAFRVDQGPRVWRSVGQRPHNLAKRV